MNDLVKTKPLSDLIKRSITISEKGDGSASIKYDKMQKKFLCPVESCDFTGNSYYRAHSHVMSFHKNVCFGPCSIC